MVKRYKTEEGFTLVEILASLVILGIVFIGFMTLFPQMTLFNSKTEAKLETMNLARRALVLVKEEGTALVERDAIMEDEHKMEYEFTHSMLDPTYTYVVAYYKQPVINKNTHHVSIQLNQIHIQVKLENDVISETFGYMES